MASQSKYLQANSGAVDWASEDNAHGAHSGTCTSTTLTGQVSSDYNFTETSIQPSEYATIYVLQSLITSGDRTLRIVGPMAIEDEFTFTIT